MTSLRFSHEYRKLDDRVFTTIRREQLHVEGDVIDITFNGSQPSFKATILAIFRKSLKEMSDGFLMYDTAPLTNTRGEAVKLLNSFYEESIDLDEKLAVYLLKKIE